MYSRNLWSRSTSKLRISVLLLALSWTKQTCSTLIPQKLIHLVSPRRSPTCFRRLQAASTTSSSKKWKCRRLWSRLDKNCRMLCTSTMQRAMLSPVCRRKTRNCATACSPLTSAILTWKLKSRIKKQSSRSNYSMLPRSPTNNMWILPCTRSQHQFSNQKKRPRPKWAFQSNSARDLSPQPNSWLLNASRRSHQANTPQRRKWAVLSCLRRCKWTTKSSPSMSVKTSWSLLLLLSQTVHNQQPIAFTKLSTSVATICSHKRQLVKLASYLNRVISFSFQAPTVA